MSSDSLAMFRKSLGPEMSALAEEHLKHDLYQSDRDALSQAASTVSLHTSAGTAIGLSLGLILAYRLRASRARIFATIRARDQPVAVKFAHGGEEAIPDLRPLMKPSRLGDFATFFFLGAGGVFFGGELGLLSGSLMARRGIMTDAESRKRIETAFRRFQADALRKQADALEQEKSGIYGL